LNKRNVSSASNKCQKQEVESTAIARLSDSTVRMLKMYCLIAGAVGLLVALLADLVGLSVGEGVSANQVTIGFISIVLIVAGITGRRFFILYKGIAFILLNVVMLLIVLDVCSLILLKLFPPEELMRSERVAQAEGKYTEDRMNWGSYTPYLVWKADTSLFFEEDVAPDGFRRTPGSVIAPEAYRVFVLGGSTVWGVGVSDSSTIPAGIQTLLESRTDRPIEIRNLGQLGWVSTQEMLQLLFLIRSGDIPDLVIFLDGMNDVAAAYQSGIAGAHQNYPAIEALMEQSAQDSLLPNPITQMLRESNTYIIVAQLIADAGITSLQQTEVINYRSFGRTADDLGNEIVETILDNYSIVRGLADQWDFQVAFFIQPSIWTGAKTPTSDESAFMNGFTEGGYAVGADPDWAPLLLSSYSLFEMHADSIEDIFSLTEIFDDTDTTIYTDFTGVHIIAEGNRIISEQMIIMLDSAGLLHDLLPTAHDREIVGGMP